MVKLLMISHNGFSDQNANGITIKKLLSAYAPEDVAQLYCGVESPDFTTASNHFRITDMDVIKAFVRKDGQHVFNRKLGDAVSVGKNPPFNSVDAKGIPTLLKRRKYNYWIRWARELMRMASPWGHQLLDDWIEEVSPTCIVYMVGESWFLDRVVSKTVKKTGSPLVLYNCEAYRLVDPKDRVGAERAYCHYSAERYAKLHKIASLVIYNSRMLERAYSTRFGRAANNVVAYNSAACLTESDSIKHNALVVTYFGNLGVGRVESLIDVARVLKSLGGSLFLDVYGLAQEEDIRKFAEQENIRYHGLVQPDVLKDVIRNSDILLHVESFDPVIRKKIKYAFSTKIAQCLQSGKYFISYAPKEIASSQYLLEEGAPLASNIEELERLFGMAIADSCYREETARQELALGKRNHDQATTARMVKRSIQESTGCGSV